MAKELLIVFLYDTEICLREEEDPQKAVVFFHPNWVSANQRMALCGQLIGVTQFLSNCFEFPHIISLNSGKFAMKKLGRYILCVGTDRNIPDRILDKRCQMLYQTLQFFHADLSTFSENNTNVCEKFTNVMEVYLPVLLYAGNIFGNSPTIRLPKSASSIFLEAAQILECLQNTEGVYGGAVFYQNKVVMSQLNTDITKQIVITDPYRIKIPADIFVSKCNQPVGLQLLIVYVDEDELKILEEQKLPSIINEQIWLDYDKENITHSMNMKVSDKIKNDRSCIFTVAEEDSDYDSLKQPHSPYLSHMPDVVKDAVKQEEDDLRKYFPDIKLQSRVVDSLNKCTISASCSNENLEMTEMSPIRYCSFNTSENENKLYDSGLDDCKNLKNRNSKISFYNTISDPLNLWFRINGLPASKALRDNQIRSYCRVINNTKNTSEKKSNNINNTSDYQNAKRPTSIELGNKYEKKKSNLTFQMSEFNLIPTKNFPDLKSNCIPSTECNVPLTPLMSKLSALELPESYQTVPTLLTPSASSKCLSLNDEVRLEHHNTADSSRKPISKHDTRKTKSEKIKKEVVLKKTLMFVFGHKNISLYLLMNLQCGKNQDLIQSMWKTCLSSLIELERHFHQCFELQPPAQLINVSNDSYSYVQVHSAWETLQHEGGWTCQQLDLLNVIHDDFNNNITLTDITVRTDDSVIYGNQMGDTQVFYQQHCKNVSGLPVPSDLMGIVQLKAKRRLERDHGLLIL